MLKYLYLLLFSIIYIIINPQTTYWQYNESLFYSTGNIRNISCWVWSEFIYWSWKMPGDSWNLSVSIIKINKTTAEYSRVPRPSSNDHYTRWYNSFSKDLFFMGSSLSFIYNETTQSNIQISSNHIRRSSDNNYNTFRFFNWSQQVLRRSPTWSPSSISTVITHWNGETSSTNYIADWYIYYSHGWFWNPLLRKVPVLWWTQEQISLLSNINAIIYKEDWSDYIYVRRWTNLIKLNLDDDSFTTISSMANPLRWPFFSYDAIQNAIIFIDWSNKVAIYYLDTEQLISNLSTYNAESLCSDWFNIYYRSTSSWNTWTYRISLPAVAPPLTPAPDIGGQIWTTSSYSCNPINFLFFSEQISNNPTNAQEINVWWYNYIYAPCWSDYCVDLRPANIRTFSGEVLPLSSQYLYNWITVNEIELPYITQYPLGNKILWWPSTSWNIKINIDWVQFNRISNQFTQVTFASNQLQAPTLDWRQRFFWLNALQAGQTITQLINSIPWHQNPTAIVCDPTRQTRSFRPWIYNWSVIDFTKNQPLSFLYPYWFVNAQAFNYKTTIGSTDIYYWYIFVTYPLFQVEDWISYYWWVIHYRITDEQIQERIEKQEEVADYLNEIRQRQEATNAWLFVFNCDRNNDWIVTVIEISICPVTIAQNIYSQLLSPTTPGSAPYEMIQTVNLVWSLFHPLESSQDFGAMFWSWWHNGNMLIIINNMWERHAFVNFLYYFVLTIIFLIILFYKFDNKND